jgi:hypothetical protein
LRAACPPACHRAGPACPHPSWPLPLPPPAIPQSVEIRSRWIVSNPRANF